MLFLCLELYSCLPLQNIFELSYDTLVIGTVSCGCYFGRCKVTKWIHSLGVLKATVYRGFFFLRYGSMLMAPIMLKVLNRTDMVVKPGDILEPI